MPSQFIAKLFGESKRYGDYEIIDLISEGGMSHVYKARRISDGTIVALKVLKTETLPSREKMERLARRSEGEIATSLIHENVVRTYEYGQRGEEYYIAMEYIDGPNLRDMILDGKPEKTRERMKIIMQIGRGLEYIHGRGLVHRDLCPKNILLTSDGVAKIIDFGLAIVEREKVKHLWERAGTASYMAPEQIRGSQGDYRVDIYAFGVTMYEILAGRRPFEGDNRLSKMQGHLNMQAPPLTQFNPKVHPAVEEIVLKCMEKNPDDRPQSITAVLNQLALASRIQAKAWKKKRKKREAKKAKAAKAER